MDVATILLEDPCSRGLCHPFRYPFLYKEKTEQRNGLVVLGSMNDQKMMASSERQREKEGNAKKGGFVLFLS